MSSPQTPDFQKAEVTPISITVDVADIIRRSGCAMCVLENAHGIDAYPARVMDGVLYVLRDPSYSFDLEGRCLSIVHGEGPKMLAWRTWHSAWRVLDPRVSALLNRVDDIVEGEPREISRPAVLGAPYGKDAEPAVRGDIYERTAKLVYGEGK